MKEVSGSYKKGKKEVRFSVSIPENWEELNQEQFARIIELLTFSKADKYTTAVSLLVILFEHRNFHILENLDPELRIELIPLINFIHSEKPTLKNFFPILNFAAKNNVAPAEDLSNLGFGEWCFAHQYYIYYVITRDIHWLNMLIGTIYRPLDNEKSEESNDYNGDLRLPFNENRIEKAAQFTAEIEFHIKNAVFAWFSLAVEDVAKPREHLFPPASENEKESSLDSEIPKENWLTVFRQLLGPKFGTEDKLKFTNAMFVLDYLEEQKIDYKKALAQN